MKYLIGIDKSTNATAALDSITRIAKRETDELELVHFVSPVISQFEELAGIDAQKEAQALLGGAEARLRDAGFRASSVTLSDDPRSGLSDAAVARAADCVVVGARGLSFLESVLFGSVSTSLINKSAKPALVVHSPIPDKPHLRFLFCHDGTDAHSSRDAFTFMLAMARPGDIVLCAAVAQPVSVTAKMQLLTGCDPNLPEFLGEINEANAEDVQRDLDMLTKLCQQQQLEATSIFKVGEPKEVLQSVCAGNDIDIVVVGCRPRGPIEKFMLGSVSTTIVQHGRAHAVLVVKAASPE